MKTSMWQAGKNAVTQWIEDEPFQLAAALSYYTLFSLAPLLVIAISMRVLLSVRKRHRTRLSRRCKA